MLLILKNFFFLEKVVCVNSIKRLTNKELLIISLNQLLPANSLIWLQIQKFQSTIVNNNALIHRNPSAWERERVSWIMGTLNEGNRLRNIFPGIDESNTSTILKLCLEHPKQTTVR